MKRRGKGTFLLMAQCATVLAALIGYPAAAQEAPQTLARELLREMIETDTTGEHGDTTPLANALAAQFRKAGYPAEDVQVLGPQTRHCNLVVRLRGSGRARPILVISHLDVVEAKPEDWTVPPFNLTEKDGWLYGRGTQDIKGEAAAEVASFLQLKQEGIVPKRDFILALTTGEEGGTFYNGVDWLLKNHRELIDAEYCLNGIPMTWQPSPRTPSGMPSSIRRA